MAIIKKMQMLNSLPEYKAYYLKAKNAYYNGAEPVMTDAAFDKLEDKIRKLDPDWSELAKTGVQVKNKKTEVALKHYMPSLSKAYPEDMPKWLAKHEGPYYTMDKLDGSSLQVEYSDGKPVKVVTRGDGTNGGDISFLIPHLNLPKVKYTKPFTLRCEALMDKKSFAKKWAGEFDNSRNAVNGLLNRRTPHPALKDVRIVVLGVFDQPLNEGLAFATSVGLDVVAFGTYANVNPELLADVLHKRKTRGEFEVDGLVVAPAFFKVAYKNADKPKGIIAFKVNDEANADVVTVKRIIWQVTGRSRIVPKIEIEPTKMDGVMVKHCTSHNAQWMLDRKIGPGAQVKVLRSGGVIPKIVDVVKPGKFQKPDIPYKVDGVHFVVANATKATSRTIAIKNIVKFMVTMGIEFFAEKTVAALYDVGLKSPVDYVDAWQHTCLDTYLVDAGYAGKQGKKLEAELERVFGSRIPLRTLIVASQCFGVGIGDRKLKMIEDAGIALADVFGGTTTFNLEALSEVRGFSSATVAVLMGGIDSWDDFYDEVKEFLDIDGSLPKKKKTVGGKLAGKKISFTGYRDKDHEAYVIANGGEVVPFGAKTEILLFKEGGKSSSKVDKAIEKGIKVMSFSALEKSK